MEKLEKLAVLIDADAVLHCHRDITGIAHGSNAVPHAFRLAHEREHGAVGGLARVHVQETYTRDFANSSANAVDNLARDEEIIRKYLNKSVLTV